VSQVADTLFLFVFCSEKVRKYSKIGKINFPLRDPLCLPKFKIKPIKKGEGSSCRQPVLLKIKHFSPYYSACPTLVFQIDDRMASFYHSRLTSSWTGLYCLCSCYALVVQLQCYNSTATAQQNRRRYDPANSFQISGIAKKRKSLRGINFHSFKWNNILN
jgi:hypothetical protein